MTFSKNSNSEIQELLIGNIMTVFPYDILTTAFQISFALRNKCSRTLSLIHWQTTLRSMLVLVRIYCPVTGLELVASYCDTYVWIAVWILLHDGMLFSVRFSLQLLSH